MVFTGYNMNLNKQEVQTILNNAPAGADKKQILDGLIVRGYNLEGVDNEKVRILLTPKKENTFGQNLAETYTNAGDRIKGAVKQAQEEFQAGTSNTENGVITPEGVLQAGKAIVRGVGRTAGTVAGATFAPILDIPAVKNTIESGVESVMQNDTVATVAGKAAELAQKYPEAAKDLEDIVNIATVGIGKVGEKPVQELVTKVGKKALAVPSGIAAGVKTVSNSVTNNGIIQGAKEIAERAPRAVKRVTEAVDEAKTRATKIKNATPEVADAMKSNLDERIINRVTETAGRGDDSIRSYDEVLKIAEETPKDIGMKRQPSIVSGDIAAKQYDLINKQKQAVGKEIGETAKKLSKTETLNMQDSLMQMDDTLSGQGIKPTYTKQGVKLDFSGTKYTPAERTKIQELYNLATEGGDELSPVQIRQKDQLFSKLKREANFEGVGNIIIETADGNKSLFDVFRDIYSSKLDTISPEIKALNSKYRKLSLLTDDIEDSIFKTPNFNVVKNADPAEFAKVNLRRIFGESQSSPVYEGVADAMDAAARGLGYKGASAKEVAEFAQELRKLFPDTIPKTGFTGGIKMGVGDILEGVSKIGAPNLKDQQQAIRKLLDSLTNK